ncbi:MAG: hypothetical protein QM753_10590 [Thermomicrobiales bacterium]
MESDGPTSERRSPGLVARRPHPRHVLTSISANHKPQKENSIILPGVDVRADIDAINQGCGRFDPATRQVLVHGRIYGMHDDGRTFPMRGEGIVELSRGAFRALTILRAYNGPSDAADYRMSRELDITEDDRLVAMALW